MSEAAEAWQVVAQLSEIADGCAIARVVEGQRLVICRLGADLFALDGVCTHAETELDSGRLRRERLSCPLHGAAFDVRSGAVLRGPAPSPLRRFAVRRREPDLIEICLRSPTET